MAETKGIFLTRHIGKTTYKVRIHLSETANETMEDKILRLIRNDCRFVKHIGQGRRREPLWEQPNEEDAWDGSGADFGGQLAAHQSRRGNRNDACRRSAFGPLYDYVPPFRCAWAYRGG